MYCVLIRIPSPLGGELHQQGLPEPYGKPDDFNIGLDVDGERIVCTIDVTKEQLDLFLAEYPTAKLDAQWVRSTGVAVVPVDLCAIDKFRIKDELGYPIPLTRWCGDAPREGLD